ncbi:hypothetical protein [Limoniibacter endophyticus]|uniref:Uncharacterized protein n=1 Tax=Limoniibacter endophyticus TaxID=1565040 RepID=A0A8J3GFU7_9HYPH|nr:hypothetical protein [Limoniibacter endophyticus]GHC60822.1 hypothetical protein GCM10010136_01070 [Limoniibacter endophyticus]
MSGNSITVELSDTIIAALDDWRVKRQPSPTRSVAIATVLDEWARTKPGRSMTIVDEGTHPEELNASNDD